MADTLLKAIDVGLSSARKEDPKGGAFGLRRRGECLEAKEAQADALTAYDEALALDPKVGVKRRADQLRKSFGSR